MMPMPDCHLGLACSETAIAEHHTVGVIREIVDYAPSWVYDCCNFGLSEMSSHRGHRDQCRCTCRDKLFLGCWRWLSSVVSPICPWTAKRLPPEAVTAMTSAGWRTRTLAVADSSIASSVLEDEDRIQLFCSFQSISQSRMAMVNGCDHSSDFYNGVKLCPKTRCSVVGELGSLCRLVVSTLTHRIMALDKASWKYLRNPFLQWREFNNSLP